MWNWCSKSHAYIVNIFAVLHQPSRDYVYPPATSCLYATIIKIVVNFKIGSIKLHIYPIDHDVVRKNYTTDSVTVSPNCKDLFVRIIHTF